MLSPDVQETSTFRRAVKKNSEVAVMHKTISGAKLFSWFKQVWLFLLSVAEVPAAVDGGSYRRW